MSSTSQDGKLKKGGVAETAAPQSSEAIAAAPKVLPAKKAVNSKARTLRLDQNRKAARESRRRKKAMIEELQRSLLFFTKANQDLKVQNEDLTRRLLQAHTELAKMGKPIPEAMGKSSVAAAAAAAKGPDVMAAAATMATAGMQPGATMQAMANFQQAAAAAMQEAAARSGTMHTASELAAVTKSMEV